MKAKAKPRIHQLTNMEIHEVSLVDHAANKRRFLIAKRSEPMSENEETASPPGEAETPPADTPTGDAAEAQDSVGETNALLREVLQALKANAPSTVTSPPANVSVMEPDQGTAELNKSLQQRLTRLEKHFGLPQSASPEDRPRRQVTHSWPFDINQRVTEEAPAHPGREQE